MAAPRSAKIPRLVYGTAWKKDRTAELVSQALFAGFRGIDTAAQPKHYQEHLVGEGIRHAISLGKVIREDIYLQTKYTSVQGQDINNLPYDRRSPIVDQVQDSIASSLHNLRHSETEDDAYLDCVVMHSPLPTMTATMEAWSTLERYVPHKVRTLGISNVTLPILENLHANAIIKPSVVQNRFYGATGYDADVRAFCANHGILYQSFWTLTGNPQLLDSRAVHNLADAVPVSDAVALYGLVLGLGGVSVLDGTTNKATMELDLAGIATIDAWQNQHREEWSGLMHDFQSMLTR